MAHRKRKILKKIALRIIFLPLIFLALLFAAGLLIINTMFTQKDLEAVTTDQLQVFFKRPVQIASARLSLSGEIKIKGLTVIEPGPEAQNFITADYILATYRLAPLLRQKIELDSVILVSPTIELVRRSSGTWNFSDILASYRQATTKKHRLNKIDSAEIRNGNINLRYPASNAFYTFENVNFSFKNLKPDSDAPFSLSAYFKRITPTRDLEGRVYAEGLLNLANFNSSLAEAKNMEITLTALNKSFKASGYIKNFRRPFINLLISAEQLTNYDFEPLFHSHNNFILPRAKWRASAQVEDDKTLTVKASAPGLGLRTEGTVSFEQAKKVYNFTVFTQLVEFARIKAIAPDLPFSNPAGAGQIRLNFTNKSGKPAVSKLVLTSGNLGMNYRNLSFEHLNISALFSESFKNNYMKIKSGTMQLKGFRATELRLDTEITPDKLTGEYAALLNGQRMTGRLVINNPLTDKKTAEFTAYGRRLDIKETRDFILEFNKIKSSDGKRINYEAGLPWVKTIKNSIPSGFATFHLLCKTDFLKHQYFDARTVYLSANLSNLNGQLEKLKGTVSIKSGSGTFYDVQQTSEKDRLYYILSLPILTMYHLNRMGALKLGYKLDNINFNSIGGDYSFDTGKIIIRNFYLAGKEFSIYTTGAVDLANENIKLKVYTISDKYYSMGSLPESMTDASGKPALAFTIEGDLKKPVVAMLSPRDAGKIIADAAKKGVGINTAKIDKFAGGTN